VFTANLNGSMKTSLKAEMLLWLTGKVFVAQIVNKRSCKWGLNELYFETAPNGVYIIMDFFRVI